MCMFCAAIPVTAAAGVSLDNKQRRRMQAQAGSPSRLRPTPVLTLLAISLLMVGSVIFHTHYPRLW